MIAGRSPSGDPRGLQSFLMRGCGAPPLGQVQHHPPPFGGVACVEGGRGFGESDSLISPIRFRSSSANRRSLASEG